MPEDYAKLHALRSRKINEGDIFAPIQSIGIMKSKDDGTYEFTIPDTTESGPYSVEIHVTGKNPETGRIFSRTKRFATLIG